MANNQFINLEELSKTTQALLSKINEQSNLKVNKANVSAEYSEGTKIAEIENIEIYAPEVDTSNFITWDDDLGLSGVAYSGSYNDLSNTPTLATVATSGNYNDLNNRPSLATVATSGLYINIQNSPQIPIIDIDINKHQIVSSLFYPTSSYPTFLLHNLEPIQFSSSITISPQVTSNKQLLIFICDASGKSQSSGTIPKGYHYVTDYTVQQNQPYNSATMYLNTQAYNSITVSGHTVAANVPANAKFTDTVYDDTAISSRITTLENAGYITSYIETDPTVPEWAKAATKPTYTASEVGAASTSDLNDYVKKLSETNGNGYTISQSVGRYGGALSFSAYGDYTAGLSISGVSGSVSITGNLIVPTPTHNTYAANKQYVDNSDKLKTTASSDNTEYNLIGTETSNTNTAGVSIYKQDLLSFAKTSNLSRLTIGSTSMPGVVRIYTSADSASGFTDIKSNASSTNERTITLPDASGTVALTSDLSNYVIGYNSSNSNSSYITHDAGHITIKADTSRLQNNSKIDLNGSTLALKSWSGIAVTAENSANVITLTPTTTTIKNVVTPTENGDAVNKEYVDGLVSGMLHYKGTKATVSALPSSGNTTGDVWHITADGSEWAWDGSSWQELGTTVDLSGYVPSSRTVNGKALTSNISLDASDVSALPSSTTYVSSFNGQSGTITYIPPVSSVNGQTGVVSLSIPDVPSWALASSKPSYTASEVGALPSSTTYVSSFNGSTGAITYSAPVASVNGQTGAVTLSIPSTPTDIGAASATHAHGNITNAGDITTTATIASGDRIVINDESASKVTNSSITFGSSTAQYLANNGTWQNAYDDTALAARVSALEQIPWVTYYTGSTTPSNSQGNNGDLYFQTAQ